MEREAERADYERLRAEENRRKLKEKMDKYTKQSELIKKLEE
jgi:hypothetical protein